MDIIDIKSKSDERGKVSFIQESEIPFPVKRVFWIKPNNTSNRGTHANYKCKQCFICVKGKFKVTLDDGSKKEEVILDSDDKGLVVEPMIWRTLSDFSDECIILVLASEEYDEADYIRDYDKFKEVCSK